MLLVGLEGLTKGRARLYSLTRSVEEAGVLTEWTFECIGSAGGRYRPLMRALWDESMPIEQGWPLALFFINWAQHVDLSVGEGIDVFVGRDDEGVKAISEEEVDQALKGADSLMQDLPVVISKRLRPMNR